MQEMREPTNSRSRNVEISDRYKYYFLVFLFLCLALSQYAICVRYSAFVKYIDAIFNVLKV